MVKIIERFFIGQIYKYLDVFPVVGLVGPRQCGKSTIAKHLSIESITYVDLENREDSQKLTNTFNFFRENDSSVIILDEIQYLPDIFVDIKSYIDQNRRNGKFLILGSASPQLIKQSAESLAGRIGYVEMSNFLWMEIKHLLNINEYCFLGGYPNSVLSNDDYSSRIWLNSYIRTTIERDIAYLSPGIEIESIRSLYTMLSHLHGQKLNISKLSKSLDISFRTIKKYLEILKNTYLLFSLVAYSKNLKKRIIKSPKIYISDSGLVHAMLNIHSVNELFGHPIYGFSFEGMIIKNIAYTFPDAQLSYYETSNGGELDCVMHWRNKLIGIEIKSSSTPNVSRGFWNAIRDIGVDEAWILSQVDERIVLRSNVYISNLTDFINYYTTNA